MAFPSAPSPLPYLPALGAIALAAAPSRAAEDDAPKGPAVTVLKATKSCFAAIVELSGTIMPREETAMERQVVESTAHAFKLRV